MRYYMPSFEDGSQLMSEKHHKDSSYWRERLSVEQYRVCRQAGTEAPFSGAYWDSKETGFYCCVGCDRSLFSSHKKYDSGSGWPSFLAPISEQALGYSADKRHGLERAEVHCKHCCCHLGHVFEDGPLPDGKRFCINSAALRFVPSDDV